MPLLRFCISFIDVIYSMHNFKSFGAKYVKEYAKKKKDMEITVSLVVWLICISFSVLYQHYYATKFHIAISTTVITVWQKDHIF